MTESERIELGKDCIKLMARRLSNPPEITMQEYCDGLMVLNSKYPGLGFNHVADSLYHKWIRQIQKPIEHKPLDRKQIASGEMEEEIPF